MKCDCILEFLSYLTHTYHFNGRWLVFFCLHFDYFKSIFPFTLAYSFNDFRFLLHFFGFNLRFYYAHQKTLTSTNIPRISIFEIKYSIMVNLMLLIMFSGLLIFIFIYNVNFTHQLLLN